MPSRFPSVRQPARPGMGMPRPSFLDDSSLVALRYEKTKPAEPPIPLPPARAPRRACSVASTTKSARTGQSASSNLSSPAPSPGLVVVAPPSGYFVPAPGLIPPAEQHPALRTSVSAASARALDDRKRDSGHAPTAASSATIHEEDEEDEVHGRAQGKQRSSGAVQPAAHGATEQSGRGLRFAGHAAALPPPGSCCSSCSPSSSPPPSPKPSLRRLLSKHGSLHLTRSRSRSSQSAKAAETLAPMQPQTQTQTPKSLLRGPAPPLSANGSLPTVAMADSLSPAFCPDQAAGFSPLSIAIPTDNLIDDDFMAGFSFSKRGSIMFGGQRAMPSDADGASDALPSSLLSMAPLSQAPTRTAHSSSASSLPKDAASTSHGTHPAPLPDFRLLPADVEKDSLKVRSLYAAADSVSWEEGMRHSFCERLEPTPEVPVQETDNDARAAPLSSAIAISRCASAFSHRPDSLGRDTTQLAGGLEDWQDINGADVDRYGFINAPRPTSRISTPTELKSSQFSPRRRNLLHKRDPMGFSSQLGGGRMPSRKVSARSLNTQNSEMSVASGRSGRSVLRQASNLLPHNRNRRWMDEAGDMLTVSPSLQDIVEEAQVEKISEAIKRKEWERSEKWRKMAKVVNRGDEDQGQGMEFEFDVRNPKLVERTWKGIPDRWRAAAWWSFLASAAKEHPSSASVEHLVAAFYDLLEKSSPDDVQIDLDVPRTINRHIMFRRRYRGGQRLLFRVLHCLSIYFPDTGYVQGMASLAATLLCYFDEEKCFVMLVRMWELRGLSRLYRPGFEGLMAALDEFKTHWLHEQVANRLSELCVDTTAYGTRWYLTLFNLSIPFAAQLRVWDVFLLLGSGDDKQEQDMAEAQAAHEPAISPTGLDVLHATAAALMQALREVLLDADFENAMKALTSWISIKDEELLMKVTKAEWKTHHGKRKA
ncbi:hypothetical protein CDD81_2359 [Ophiocordyceps australis]|uniref:Rab-GAP TBC domain-containing protein n=1 Tax=Ophiocordyceps australis TaxID=1399860 RepID=A0A2C5XER0_9HYPO|nr:hypothetical protein CDD81_2359 [Ophiocordyceps australis]